MLAVKAIAAALFGSVFGYVLFALAGYPLFLAAAGGRDMNGGIAMGMATMVGPVGAVVGALAGPLLVLVRDARKTDPASGSRGGAKGVLVGAGVLAALYVTTLVVLQGPAKIRLDREPDLHVEIRTDAGALARTGGFAPHADLHAVRDDSAIAVPVTVNIEGDRAVLSGSFRVIDGLQGRRYRAHLAPDLTVVATIPLYPGMELAPGFTDWHAVDTIVNPLTGDLDLAFAQKVHMVRYRAVPRDDR